MSFNYSRYQWTAKTIAALIVEGPLLSRIASICLPPDVASSLSAKLSNGYLSGRGIELGLLTQTRQFYVSAL